MIPTVFLPIAGGMGARLIPFSRRLKQIFLLAVIIATSVLTALQIFRGDGNSAVLFSVMDDLTLVFRLDGAGKIFAGLLALLWPPAMLYTYLYMQGRNAEGFFCFYTMSYGVALAIAFAGNLFTLYAFYECLTMVTLPLVAFNKDRAARKAGQTYVNFSIVKIPYKA
jgi:multicomponent Na+:H+ antiporter subunit D